MTSMDTDCPVCGGIVVGHRIDIQQAILAHDFTPAERAALAAALLTPGVLAEAIDAHGDACNPRHAAAILAALAARGAA